MPIIEIDIAINKHIYDYNKEFINFDCSSNIQNESFCEKSKLVWTFVPDIIEIQEKIIKRYDCNRNDFVYIEIIFITD